LHQTSIGFFDPKKAETSALGTPAKGKTAERALGGEVFPNFGVAALGAAQPRGGDGHLGIHKTGGAGDRLRLFNSCRM
jgi:hypothetical protein